MAKVVCVLYDDPVDGYPKSYARDDVPTLERYPDGQSLPSPKRIDFKPGELLGCVSGELGLRKFLEDQGHTLVVTSDKDGPDSVFEKQLPDAEVVISQPFWPAYLTAARIAKAPKLKLAITAGIGSDHVDLQAAIERGLTVAEVTYSNSISVSEHVVMMILSLVRNYIPSYQWVVKKGWNIADCVERSYDLEGMTVGTVAAGRIGLAVLKRLKPFDVKLHYTDRHRLPDQVEKELGLTYHPNVESLVRCAMSSRSTARSTPRRSTCSTPAHRQDEARRLHREHSAGQDLRPGRHRPGPGERAAWRVCGRRLVPPAAAARPPVADDAPPRHDATHFRDEPVSTGAVRRGDPGDPGMLVRGPADSRAIPDRRRRQAGRGGGAFLQRRECHRRLGRSGAVQEELV